MQTGLLIQGSYFHDSYEEFLKEVVENFDEVVVSTWLGVIVPDVQGVKCIRLQDPGADLVQVRDRKRTNYFRHLHGVSEGLKQMKSEKIVKVRSDISFDSKALLKLEWHRNILLASNVTSKTFSPLYVSDWVHIATRENLISCYSDYDKKLLLYMSFEEYIALKFLINNDLNPIIQQFSSKKINLRSFKKGYKFLPLDLNILFRPNTSRINLYNEGNFVGYNYGLNSFLIPRIIVWYTYRLIRFVYHTFR